MKKIINSLIVCILSLQYSYAQQSIDFDFIKHLSQENKKIEHLQYLKSEIEPNDTLSYLKAKYYIQYKIDSSFEHHFIKSKSLFLQDTLAVGFTSCYLLSNDSTKINKNEWFQRLNNYSFSKDVNRVTAIYNIKFLPPKEIRPLEYPNLLKQGVIEYKLAKQKNPLKAALFSAVMPGLGKIYIGKYRMGLSTAFVNGLFAYQTYESIHRLGVKHPLSILNLLLATIFYSSNIYGSYRDTQYFKEEKLQQLYHDASNYYSVQSFPYLYK